MKKYFEDWNLFERIYVIVGITLSIATNIIFKGDLLQLIYSLGFVLNSILLSKGKIECYLFGIASNLSYVFISARQHYYGESITNLFLYFPLDLYALYKWYRNMRKKDRTVAIKQLTKKQILTAFLAQIPLVFVYYGILKTFNTERIYLSVISMMFSVLAVYFQAQISIWSLICFLAGDLFIVTLWLLPILQGNISLISIIIVPLLLTVSDIYGVYNWRRLRKLQQEEDKEK